MGIRNTGPIESPSYAGYRCSGSQVTDKGGGAVTTLSQAGSASPSRRLTPIVVVVTMFVLLILVNYRHLNRKRQTEP
ncbi:hypothetical protein TSMEX_005968, partial [Taenia solium]